MHCHWRHKELKAYRSVILQVVVLNRRRHIVSVTTLSVAGVYRESTFTGVITCHNLSKLPRLHVHKIRRTWHIYITYYFLNQNISWREVVLNSCFTSNSYSNCEVSYLWNRVSDIALKQRYEYNGTTRPSGIGDVMTVQAVQRADHLEWCVMCGVCGVVNILTVPVSRHAALYINNYQQPVCGKLLVTWQFDVTCWYNQYYCRVSIV